MDDVAHEPQTTSTSGPTLVGVEDGQPPTSRVQAPSAHGPRSRRTTIDDSDLPVTLASYRIDRVLAEGGMAVVYQAEHVRLGSLHALKRLRIPESSVRERLLQEARVQAGIDHPNIVPVTDLLDTPMGPILVMPYIQGPTLEQHLIDHGPMDPAEVLRMMRGLLAGIDAAHRHDVVHRDLKPANVLLQPTNTGLMPRIADFGLVKLGDRLDTRDGALMGTPEYMSPEQVRNSADVDCRSDLWALGAIAYQMLTGRIAFRGPDNFAVFHAIAEGRRPPLDAGSLGAPRELIEVVDGLLIVDRNERIQSAQEATERLDPSYRLTSLQPTRLLSIPPTDPASEDSYDTMPPAFRSTTTPLHDLVTPMVPPRLQSLGHVVPVDGATQRDERPNLPPDVVTDVHIAPPRGRGVDHRVWANLLVLLMVVLPGTLLALGVVVMGAGDATTVPATAATTPASP